MLQSPEFEQFKQLFQNRQFEAALAVLDQMLPEYPNTAALHWHRSNCLFELGRQLEALDAAEQVIQAKPDYIPARLRRVEWGHLRLEADAPAPDYLDDDDEEALTPRERLTRETALRAHERAAREWRNTHLDDLQEILKLAPDHARALFLMWSMGGEDNAVAVSERDRLLDRAISIEPENIEYRAARAAQWHSRAMVEVAWDSDEEPPLDPKHVQTFNGMRYDRNSLERALSDYELCWKQGGEIRHALKSANILHELGRFDQALARYDEALKAMPADAPHRELVREQRARSENNGAGEREQMAKLLLGSLLDDKERNLEDDIGAQSLRGMAESLRQGKSINEAIAINVSEDPDTMMAMNLARQILNVANEPAPGLVAAQAQEFPAYQRKHCDRLAKEANELGLKHIADAEARGLFEMMGQRVLLRVYANAEGDIGMAGFAMKPKWPGWIGFLLMLFTGKWKAHRMIECVSQFSDGTCISTQPESISPFEYGGKVQIHKLPSECGPHALYQYHHEIVTAFRERNPLVSPMRIHDLAGIEARWIAGQQSKADYRRSIGYVTDSELRNMLGKHYERFAAKIRTQLQRMAD